MSVSIDNIQSLGRLARLSLTDDEVSSMQKTLNEIVVYVESLQKVGIDGVEPMTHAVPMELALREDVARPGVGREGLSGSAGYEGGLVKVPKIIE
jgi:aspartyl-tRNA(Asn)/glutamyl-tRNA(Gln) amidotransferase subunit C